MFVAVTNPTSLLRRSFLAVPGNNAALFPKAARSGADQVFLDLEDAVAASDKEQARSTVVAGLHDVDWKAGGQSITVRVNAPDTSFIEGDLRQIVTDAGNRLDTILVPKIDRAGDLIEIEQAVRDLEAESGVDEPIGLEILIESAAGFLNLAEIAAASTRLEALHFGAGDFAASMGARTTDIGRSGPEGDQWQAVKIQIVAAARAHGLRPMDSAYDDFKDDQGYLASARRAAAIGFEGKWAIHPAQVPLANQVFTPTETEITRARQILAAMDEAANSGRGAAQIDGKMIDAATTRMAENIVAIADRAGR